MNKCLVEFKEENNRQCGKPAKLYNNHFWLCDEHKKELPLFAAIKYCTVDCRISNLKL